MSIFLGMIFIFLLGAAVGSFLNVVIFRFGNERIIKGRSKCPHCGKILEWFELIPIFSFILQAGKCRLCKKNISLQYPIVEILTGLTFVGIFWRFIFRSPLGINYVVFFSEKGFWIWPLILFWIYYSSTLIAISVYDIKHYIIPDAFLFPAIGAAILEIFYILATTLLWGKIFFIPQQNIVFSGPEALIFGIVPFGIIGSKLFGAMISVLLIFLPYFLSKGRAMGFGDVKLALFLGLSLGWPDVLVAIFLAFSFGMIWSIFAIFLKRKTMKSYLPFAPFLVAGTFATIFIGDWILSFYSKYLPNLFISLIK
jgi:leader peptidase (prepilin peptidase)/N-methyltransferase